MKPILRFLITGDLQCHQWKQFSTTLPDGTNSRLENTLRVLDIVRREAKSRKINKVILNGDILEESDEIHTETYTGLYKRIESLYSTEVDTVINPGNHDVVREIGGTLRHSLVPLRGISTIIERPKKIWNHVWVVPWNGSANSYKASIKAIQIDRSSNPNILVTHIGIAGSLVGNQHRAITTPIRIEDLRPKKFKLILLSDFHTRQKVSPNMFYLGSPIQHNFGEVHNPCIWEVRLYNESPWYRRIAIETNLPRFISATVSSKRDVDNLVKNYQKDYLRIKVASDSGPNVSESLYNYLEHCAKEAACQIQIVRETDIKKRVQIPKIVNIEKVIKKYAKKRRLINLGLNLFQ